MGASASIVRLGQSRGGSRLATGTGNQTTREARVRHGIESICYALFYASGLTAVYLRDAQIPLCLLREIIENNFLI